MLSRLMLACFLTFAIAAVPAPFGPDSAIAATKKKKKISHKRSDFTPEQREKMMERARQICRKNYGAGATVYRLDYYHWKVWCREN